MAGADTIVSRVRDYVYQLFDEQKDRKLLFHSRRHTEEVVEAAQEIGKNSGLSIDDMEIVQVAAWLHDIGYLFTYQGHEEKSVEIGRKFLEKQGYDEDRIERVAGCILATQVPQKPKNLTEQVLCDADMSHLSKDDVEERAKRLRDEWSYFSREQISNREWMEQNLRFMQAHDFFTDYARREYGPAVLSHINQLETRLSNEQSRASDIEQVSVEKNDEEQKKKKKLKKMKEKLSKLEGQLQEVMSPDDAMSVKATAARHDRGIETMFRITSRNHLDLSSMADSKANILISVNSIIISIVASMMLSKLDANPFLTVPTFILLASCLFTIITAIIATRPKVSSGTFTQKDIEEKKVNLLFFGNFHGVELDDYMAGVYSMMHDSDYLYSSLIKDIYYLGQVLGRKYRFLRYSYNIFMYGLIISVVAFAFAYLSRSTPVGM